MDRMRKYEIDSRLVRAWSLPGITLIYCLFDPLSEMLSRSSQLTVLLIWAAWGLASGARYLVAQLRGARARKWAACAVLWAGCWTIVSATLLWGEVRNPSTSPSMRTILDKDFDGILPNGWKARRDHRYDNADQLKAEYIARDAQLLAVALAKSDPAPTLDDFATSYLKSQSNGSSGTTWYGRQTRNVHNTPRLQYTYRYVSTTGAEVTALYAFWQTPTRFFVAHCLAPTDVSLRDPELLQNALDALGSVER